ncbi:MAG: dethiobiotin synthase [Alkalinema sp. CACIAM 70d]|nr:MAG: dethiobiotin synthase [Alkalinema sp. CACIAM 70d]
MSSLLITGTDTDAGKTLLTSALAAYWCAHCQPRSLGILKPIQTGVGDREHYQRLFAASPALTVANPLQFEAPLAPPLAADREGRSIPLDLVWNAYTQLNQTHDFVLVEGLGGLGSPVTHETTVADLAWDWRLSAVLVVPVKLGAIGQTVANVALAERSRVHLKGVVLNCITPVTAEEVDQWANVPLIENLTHVPVLGVLPYLEDPTDLDKLADIASDLAIEKLLPLSISIASPKSP